MKQEGNILGIELTTKTAKETIKKLSALYKDVIPGTLQNTALADFSALYDKRATFTEMSAVHGTSFPDKIDLIEDITNIQTKITRSRLQEPEYREISLATESLAKELNVHYRKPKKNIGNSTRQIALDLQRVNRSIEEKIRPVMPKTTVFDVRELPNKVA